MVSRPDSVSLSLSLSLSEQRSRREKRPKRVAAETRIRDPQGVSGETAGWQRTPLKCEHRTMSKSIDRRERWAAGEVVGGSRSLLAGGWVRGECSNAEGVEGVERQGRRNKKGKS